MKKTPDTLKTESGLAAPVPELTQEIAGLKKQVSLLSDSLAQAQRERNEACKVITDLRLGPPGGKPISPELKAGLNEMSEQAYERASQKGNLER